MYHEIYQLSADEQLIAAAQERARVEHTTLNEQFRLWLMEYASQKDCLQSYDELITELQGKVRIGSKLTQDEMNER